MILLDYPYVSDFLKDSIVAHQLEVVATPTAKEIMGGRQVKWVTEEDAAQKLQSVDIPMYTNSENSIAWVQQHAPASVIAERLQLFKNKFRFRQLIQEAYPDYFFRAAALERLKNIDPTTLKYPLILKPAVGFFSLAVFKIDHVDEWAPTLIKLETEVQKIQDMYPKEVVDNTEFILEEYITGEEYAFDCYFDKDGKAVVLNILHHLFKSVTDVSDRLYYTSQEVIERLHQPIMDFLQLIGSKTKLRNFPLHIEIRVSAEGKINPIEVNPMRFGGFCTTGDLAWFAYGINSYAYYFNSLKPDWETIFSTRKGKKYSLILLDNQAGISVDEFDSFDYEALEDDFEKPLHLRKYPFNKFGIFGFLFTETREGQEQEMQSILHSDLKKYIRLKN